MYFSTCTYLLLLMSHVPNTLVSCDERAGHDRWNVLGATILAEELHVVHNILPDGKITTFSIFARPEI